MKILKIFMRGKKRGFHKRDKYQYPRSFLLDSDLELPSMRASCLGGLPIESFSLVNHPKLLLQ